MFEHTEELIMDHSYQMKTGKTHCFLEIHYLVGISRKQKGSQPQKYLGDGYFRYGRNKRLFEAHKVPFIVLEMVLFGYVCLLRHRLTVSS